MVCTCFWSEARPDLGPLAIDAGPGSPHLRQAVLINGQSDMVGRFAVANRVIPVDVRGTRVRVALFDMEHQTVDRQAEPSHAAGGYDLEIRRLLKAVHWM